MALECALQIKISVFKLRTLLGERTPKNHSGKCVSLQDLQRIYPMRYAVSYVAQSSNCQGAACIFVVTMLQPDNIEDEYEEIPSPLPSPVATDDEM